MSSSPASHKDLFTCIRTVTVPHVVSVRIPGPASGFHLISIHYSKRFEKSVKYIRRKTVMIVRKGKGQKDFTSRSLALCSCYCMPLFERTVPVHFYRFLVCMSSCNVHLLYANLCEGRSVTRQAATVWCKDAYSRKIAKDKILSHIHTLYLWKPGSW